MTFGLALVLSLALIAVGVACGGSSESPSSPTPTPTPTPSPPVFTPTPIPPAPTPTPTLVVTPDVTPSAYLPHTDEANGIAVDYPAEWTWSDELMAETEDAVATFRSLREEDSFRSYMTVTKRALPISLTVAQVFNFAHDPAVGAHMATEFPGYVSVSDADITVDGLPAISHVFTFSEGGVELKAKRLWIVKEREAWVVTCVTAEAAFGSWEPVLDGIVLSFTFL